MLEKKYWRWSCKYHFVELHLKPTMWVLACLYSCNLTLAVHGILNLICVHATIVFRTSLSIICETSKIQLASITKLLHCLIQLAICITCSSNNNNHDQDNNQHLVMSPTLESLYRCQATPIRPCLVTLWDLQSQPSWISRWISKSIHEKLRCGRNHSLGILAHRNWEWVHGTQILCWGCDWTSQSSAENMTIDA